MLSVAIAVGCVYASLHNNNRALGGEAAPVADTYVSGFEIVRTLPHDPTMFTQGLAFAPDGGLYESDGLYRHSVLRQVDVETGEAIQSFRNPATLFAEGATVHDGKLLQLSWKENKIHELSVPDFKLLRVVEKKIGAEGWGLASDGSTLYVTDSGYELFHVAPNTYDILRRMPIVDPLLGGQRVHGVNELEWVNGELWGNVYPMYQGKFSECVVRINATSGHVLGWIDLTGLLHKQRSEVRMQPRNYVLNGIAYHEASRRLYVTGKKWDKLFQIRITPQPGLGASDVLQRCNLGLSSAG